MKIFAAIHSGNDIYPPVEIKASILFFFKKNKDLIIEKTKPNKLNGNKNKLVVNFGVLITVNLYFSKFKNLQPLLSVTKNTSNSFSNCS